MGLFLAPHPVADRPFLAHDCIACSCTHNTRLLLPFWDDCDKGTAHETVSISDLGNAGRRVAGDRAAQAPAAAAAAAFFSV